MFFIVSPFKGGDVGKDANGRPLHKCNISFNFVSTSNNLNKKLLLLLAANGKDRKTGLCGLDELVLSLKKSLSQRKLDCFKCFVIFILLRYYEHHFALIAMKIMALIVI